MTRKQITARWVLIALGIFWQGQAMAFSKTLYLFSEVEGVVLQDGQPVEGAVIEQEYVWHWGDQRRTSTTLTDQHGHFQFPVVAGKSLTAQFIPHEPVIVQYLRIRYDGHSYKGWFHAKHNYDVKGEYGESPLRLQCDLRDDPGSHAETASFGICIRQAFTTESPR